MLKSDASRKEKADACRLLARVGTRECVPVLAGMLGDENLSHMARYALEAIPDALVDKSLRHALGKLQGRPLVGVIGSIGVRRDVKAVDALAGLLANNDPDVAQAAARPREEVLLEIDETALTDEILLVEDMLLLRVRRADHRPDKNVWDSMPDRSRFRILRPGKTSLMRMWQPPVSSGFVLSSLIIHRVAPSCPCLSSTISCT